MAFKCEVGLPSHQQGQFTNTGQSSPTAQQSPDQPGTRKSRRTLPHARVKLELEEDSFLLGVQKPEPLDVFDFLEPFHQLLDMKINSPPPSNSPDDKELNTKSLKAMNRQMKTDESKTISTVLSTSSDVSDKLEVKSRPNDDNDLKVSRPLLMLPSAMQLFSKAVAEQRGCHPSQGPPSLRRLMN